MLENREPEIWEDIPGYEGRYQASNHGRIKSLIKQYAGTILKPAINSKGYQQIILTNSFGKRDNILSHRITALVYVPNPHNHEVVNHKDNVKDNNYYTNLEWCTTGHNNKHAFSVGAKSTSCEDHPQAKFTNDKVAEIYKLAISGQYNFSQVAEMFDTNISMVSAIKNKQNWIKVTDEVDKQLNVK